MTLLFIRGFFLLLSGVVGYYVGTLVQHPIVGIEIGLLCGLVFIFVEQRLHRISVRGLSSMVFGLLLGVFMAKLLADILSLLPLGEFILSVSRVVLTLIFSYLGAIMALRGKDEFNIIVPYVRFKRQDIKREVVLLDTSAIIDGRIGDIYKTNFILGRMVVPNFVLKELQTLADSADDAKRQKGRRGVELLREMQADPEIDIRLHESDMVLQQDVDAQLIRLARVMDARLCTTDFNLSRIAMLQGIEVLNIHELANAVKSVVFPGERFKAKLIREGKEPDQAIAYMEDGTMIVVSDGKDLIGQDVEVMVVSVLQTQAGKMVFAKIENK